MIFNNKIIVITGASSGIGEATAKYFAEKGAIIFAMARREAKLIELCKNISEGGGKAHYYTVDVSIRNEVELAISDIISKYQRIDILINNAGYGHFADVGESSIDILENLMQVNYFGSIYATKAVLPFMKTQKSGSIIAISSIVGLLAFPNFAGYSASKFAMRAFFTALYHEVKSDGIHVGVIYPSGTATEFFDDPSFNRRSKFQIYRLQPVIDVVKAIELSIVAKKPELVRPRQMRLASWFINTFFYFLRPIMAYLNPRSDET
jgi:uncharacterized protein